MFALGTVQSASATTITFGNTASSDANTFPFGGFYDQLGADRYQQVYDGALFGGVSTISSLSFYASPQGSDANADGTYTLSLSTTSSAVNGLSSAMGSNVGADSYTFFSGSLPAYPAVAGGLMTFVLPTSFAFNPAAGNLLLDVQLSGVTSTSDAFYVAHNGSFTNSSRMVNGGASGTSGFGLVTSFETDAVAAVPEPTTLLLFGTGLAAGARRYRRRS